MPPLLGFIAYDLTGGTDASLEAAIYATEELEETAKLFLLLRDASIRTLTEAQIAELRSAFALKH